MYNIEELKTKEKEITLKIKNDIKSGVEGLYPIFDGIIDIERYVKAKYKILWILKEPVDDWVPDSTEPSGKRNGGWNLVKLYAELKENEMKDLGVARRVMKVSYKLLPETGSALEAFKSIAYINVKKIPGKSSTKGGANPKLIKEAYDKYKYILEEQINTYNPQIIICGNTLGYFSQTESILKRTKDKKIAFGNNPNSIFCYYPLKEKLYINVTHPGNPKLRQETNKFWNEYVRNIVNSLSEWEKIRGENNGR